MKWKFTQCWWIPKVVDLADWDPMRGDSDYTPRVPGLFIEGVPEGGKVTDLKVRRGSHDKEWCATGFLELDDRIDEEVAYELAWEAVVQRAYTTVPDVMDGSEFEWGEVEKGKPKPRAAWGIPRKRNDLSSLKRRLMR